MEERCIWMRLGITLRGTKEEIEALFNDDDKSYDVLTKILQERRYIINGDSYIPQPQVEKYNEEYGTSHEAGEYSFEL